MNANQTESMMEKLKQKLRERIAVDTGIKVQNIGLEKQEFEQCHAVFRWFTDYVHFQANREGMAFAKMNGGRVTAIDVTAFHSPATLREFQRRIPDSWLDFRSPHLFEAGDWYVIRNNRPDGTGIIEGTAQLIEKCPHDTRQDGEDWVVVFADDMEEGLKPKEYPAYRRTVFEKDYLPNR